MHFNDSRVGLHLVAGLVAAAVLSTSVAPAMAQGKKAGAAAKGRGKKKSPEDEKREQAREAYGQGEEKFKAGDFAGAVEGYKKANEILPSPQAQFKLATALDKAGKNAEAAEAYKKFLDTAPADKMEDQKKAATERVAGLSEGKITVLSDPGGATVKIDGTSADGVTPIEAKAKPGTHTVEVILPNYETFTKTIELAANGTVKVDAKLVSAAPPPPPPAPSAPVAAPSPPPEKPAEPPPSKTPAYVTLGLAGAGAVIGTIFGLSALSAKSDFDKAPTTKGADDAERNALIADMAFGAAVTLGVTGTVLYFNATKKQEPAKTGAFRIAPMVTPKTQGAAATFSF